LVNFSMRRSAIEPSSAESERLAVEIASAHDVPVVEDERVVRHAVQIHLDDLRRVLDRVAAGAVHLGHAAEAVRVLHLAAVLVALHHGVFAVEEAADVCRDRLLSRLRAHVMDARVEGPERPANRVERKPRRDIGGLAQRARVGDGEGGESSHELRAVDQR
jgi:hypothetical protein